MLDGREPADYPRRVLLAVTGLSPQVVTETLYGLCNATGETRAFVPTEIQVITTTEGAERARLTLWTGPKAQFRAFCSSYGVEGIIFDEEGIRVVRDASGQALDDIRCEQDNTAMADFITDYVRALTQDNDTAVHVSIAGGRKTMGFYLGYALSLYGRPQDRLSHVLVSEHFESHPEFFFPTVEAQVIVTRDGRPLDTSKAQVHLADIPFVRMRQALPEAALFQDIAFSEVVDKIQAAAVPPDLVFDPGKLSVQVGRWPVPIEGVDLAFWFWLAERRRQGSDPVLAPPAYETDKQLALEFLASCERLFGEMGVDERTMRALARGMDRNYFDSRRSRLNSQLETCLGKPLARHYQILGDGPRGQIHYGLALAARKIIVKGEIG
jgi:CRISPR-associated protein (TIGR02584 family)